MPLRYVTIEKEVSFQGRTEGFSNRYLYDFTDASESNMAAAMNAVVTAEKLVHTAAVTFKKGRVFTTEGLNDPGDEGDMFLVADLTGTGSLLNSGAGFMYLECAVLVKWPLPRKVSITGALGRHRSLKKWLHIGGSGPFSSGELAATSPISSGNKTVFTTYGNTVSDPTTPATLVAPDGTVPSGLAVVHPYVEHRQFPRGRKFTL